MLLTAVDSILTVTADGLPESALDQWTQSIAVAAAAMRKKGRLPPEGVAEILSKLGWVLQGAAEKRAFEVADLPDVLSIPRIELLETFRSALNGPVQADTDALLDWWWKNAAEEAGYVLGIAVADSSGAAMAVDLRTLSIPAPGWGWLASAASPQATIIRSRFVLNQTVYDQIAGTLKEKFSAVADRVRSVSLNAAPAN